MAIRRDDFPLPDVDDPLTAPYFAGAARGELMITHCDVCDRYVWYPEATCPHCGGELTWTPVSGAATLFSWAVVRRPFLPAFAEQVPFVTALVAIDEDSAVRIPTYLVDADPATLQADEPRLKSAIARETRFGVGGSFETRRQHAVMDADWRVTDLTARLTRRRFFAAAASRSCRRASTRCRWPTRTSTRSWRRSAISSSRSRGSNRGS